MPLIRITVPLYLPRPVYALLRRLRADWNANRGSARNLRGDRDIEWSFVAATLPDGPGTALDIGPGQSHLGLIAAQRGFEVTAVDREDVRWFYRHPSLKFLHSDLLSLSWPASSVDVVINCSTVEHVGLAGRYGVEESRPEGDLECMAVLRDLMRPGGLMILTVPVGQDAVFPPYCRVYGNARLPRLLEGFAVERQTFWVKDAENRWIERDRAAALSEPAFAGNPDPLRNVYALGCFLLRK